MLQTAGKLESVSEIEVNEEELKALEEHFKDALKELKHVTEVNKLFLIQEKLGSDL